MGTAFLIGAEAPVPGLVNKAMGMISWVAQVN